MTDQERIVSLEARIAQLEARLATLEHRPNVPVQPVLYPLIAPAPCSPRNPWEPWATYYSTSELIQN